MARKRLRNKIHSKYDTARNKWSKRVLGKQKFDSKIDKKTFTESYTKLKKCTIQNIDGCSGMLKTYGNVKEESVVPESSLLSSVNPFGFIIKLSNFMMYPAYSFMAKINKVLLSRSGRKMTKDKETYEKLEERIRHLEDEIKFLKNHDCSHKCTSTISSHSIPDTSASAGRIGKVLVPPPAPPPPPPPPPALLFSKMHVTKTVEKMEKFKDKPLQPKPLNHEITEDILKAIKLRKVKKTLESFADGSKKENDPRCSVVSLADIKSVKLKRTSAVKVSVKGQTPRNNTFNLKSGSIKKSKEKKTPENIFRRNLRKINITRSPGGTPQTEKNFLFSLGEGLTPMLSNALKKKFDNARPSSTANSPNDVKSLNTTSNSPQFELSPKL